jgi:hypothetical protein
MSLTTRMPADERFRPITEGYQPGSQLAQPKGNGLGEANPPPPPRGGSSASRKVGALPRTSLRATP